MKTILWIILPLCGLLLGACSETLDGNDDGPTTASELGEAQEQIKMSEINNDDETTLQTEENAQREVNDMSRDNDPSTP